MIGIGILVLICLGFLIVSSMTGSVITGSIMNEKIIEDEYFKISDFGNELNEEVNDGTQDSSGSG